MNRYLQQLRKDSKDGKGASDSIFQLGSILRNGWLIVSVAIIVATLGIIYALTMTPVYESNMLIEIKRNASLPGENQAETPAATEIEILRSRSILSGVVNSLKLDITVEPKLFPVVGSFIAKKNKKVSNPGLFGLGGYVWGSEFARISVFNMPAPLMRKPFVLTIADNHEFTLTQEELAIRMRGQIANMARAHTKYGLIEILVSETSAKPGAQFVVSRIPASQVVAGLQKSLAISEKGRQSNVIGVSLRGSKPELISRILNELGSEYVRQQVAEKSGEAKKALAFYNQQAEESKKILQKLDARLAEVLRRHGTSDLSEEARTLAEQSVALQTKLAEKEQKKVELLGRFAELHPEIITATRNIEDASRDLSRIEAKRQVIAAAQQEIISLNRDKQINSEMNVALLNTRQKLDALTQYNNVHVRLVDRAEVPMQPVTLKLSVMIVTACLLGLVLGVLASMLKNAIVGRHQGAEGVESVRRIMISAGNPNYEVDNRADKKSTES
ncbi:GNVR domain-containing protein [Massilia niabensis]|uniref:GNVR domain-containing protein n=1 Tax=Massilia niabensis TaxID=544910 RepID=A0ABW0KY64_9BURK